MNGKPKKKHSTKGEIVEPFEKEFKIIREVQSDSNKPPKKKPNVLFQIANIESSLKNKNSSKSPVLDLPAYPLEKKKISKFPEPVPKITFTQ